MIDDERTPASDAPNEGTAPPKAEPSTQTNIVVNGRCLPVVGERVDRLQLARLAFPSATETEENGLTIAYTGGPANASSGLLAQGGSVPIQEGQRFSVARTTKS